MKEWAKRITRVGAVAMCGLAFLDYFGARLGSCIHEFTTIGAALVSLLFLIGWAMTDAANDASRPESSETKWSQFRAVVGLTETAAVNSILFLISGALLIVVVLFALMASVSFLS